MTQKQLIELVQQHHPGMGETEIRLALNRAQDDFSAKSEIIKSTYVQTSSPGKRYYSLDGQILRVLKVQINDVDIPRLISPPIIDDDEWDGATGLTAGSTASNDRYWYISNGRLAVVEKVTSAITRDDKISDYQSISVAKEMRIYAMSQATDFTSDLTEESDLPSHFHEALAVKVISDGYLRGESLNPQLVQIFDTKYQMYVKEAKKEARRNHTGSFTVRPTDF
tara:strand:- start:2254 stop:2925 length:672 start_codon:yes stop_codon:yes gene_type:complete